MAFKMKAGKEGPMYKNFPSAFKDEDKTKATKRRVVEKGSEEEAGMIAAREKIDASAKGINTPGSLPGETLSEGRKRVAETKQAHKDYGKYTNEDRARYKEMGLKPGKEMTKQKRKEKDAKQKPDTAPKTPERKRKTAQKSAK